MSLDRSGSFGSLAFSRGGEILPGKILLPVVSGLLTTPHCCLSSVCPRPCSIHRMNFAHISQTSPSTWATQGNSSIQVRGGLTPTTTQPLGHPPNCPFRFLLQEHQIHTGRGMGDSRTHSPQGRSKQRVFGDNNSNKVCLWLGNLCSPR